MQGAFAKMLLAFLFIHYKHIFGYISKSIIDISNKQFRFFLYSDIICTVRINLVKVSLVQTAPDKSGVRVVFIYIILPNKRKGGIALRMSISRPMLERLPIYASCLEKMIGSGMTSVSSKRIAKELELGEVQVRKELSIVSGTGKPRVGYNAEKLLSDIRSFLGEDEPSEAVIIGAGRLGCALLGYGSFEEVGVRIGAAFDKVGHKERIMGKSIYALDEFLPYCREHSVKIGIITVPAEEAQAVCDMMLEAGICAIWNFAPTMLKVPDGISVVNEKLAISLSHLRQQINR